MRTRKEMDVDIMRLYREGYGEGVYKQQVREILLDIRDLLTPNTKE